MRKGRIMALSNTQARALALADLRVAARDELRRRAERHGAPGCG